MNRDIVYIRDLRIDTFIGIYDWEQRIRQTISIDLEMAADIASAAAADDISATPDYEAISNRLIEYVENQHFQLIETLAEQLAQLLLAEFKLTGLRLRLGKPGAVAAAADVGVIIKRGSMGSDSIDQKTIKGV
jgi:7,8-dihydroneopterin aldolase/epimerase/oxygenase